MMRTTADVLEAFGIPAQARIDKRVPKKTLIEQGTFAPGDKRKVQDGVEELIWVAALKPSNIAVKEYSDGVREYLEIAVLSANFTPEAGAPRLVELIHRAIPYPVVLIAGKGKAVHVSLAHKRLSQGEAGKVVLDGDISAVVIDGAGLSEEDFLKSLAVTAQPSGNLFELYKGWMGKLVDFKAGQLTGEFVVTKEGSKRSDALLEYEKICERLKELRAKAGKEKQMNRRVEINLEIQRLDVRLKQIVQSLKGRE